METLAATERSVVGESPAWLAALQRAERVAPHLRTPVLITGETGTGKEVIARQIHEFSALAGPFVAVNSANFSREFIGSELFGHVKGAFTGASADRPSYLREAAGGTLFLDEIGEMSADLQAQLLRVLDNRQARALGESTDYQVNVRILTATNRDLAAEVLAGRFREDLFYRLNGYQIELAPLRERGADEIALLAEHFLRKHCRTNLHLAFDPDAMARLQSHSFPGNVRELRSIVDRAVINCAGQTIRPDEIEFAARQKAETAPSPAELVAQLIKAGLQLDDLKKLAIEQALELTDGNKTEAARLLGVSVSTINNHK
jgi:DNA-binding NtrC family response regulator